MIHAILLASEAYVILSTICKGTSRDYLFRSSS